MKPARMKKLRKMDRKKLLLVESSEKVIKPAKLLLFAQSERKKDENNF